MREKAVKALKKLISGFDYETQKAMVAAALGFIDPTKPYGPELFNAYVRIGVTPAIEAVALRKKTGSKSF